MLIKEISKGLLCASALAFLASISTLKAAVLTGIDPVSFTVGSGPDVSYLLIDESTLSSAPLLFEYRYTYDILNPISGYELLHEAARFSSLDFTTIFYGGGLGNALDSVSYGGITVSSFTAPDLSTGTYWSYYVAGGSEVDEPLAAGLWKYAEVGMDSRFITPGSWDGWTLAGWNPSFGEAPSISPVPEPAPLPLAVLSLAALFFFIRWKQKWS
ncbi:MAG: hypothetical protein ACOYMT_01185 [Chthoniobacterales bacterium]